jgi:hypothetical protein
LKEQEDDITSRRKNKGVAKKKFTPHDFRAKTKKKVVVQSDEDADDFVEPPQKKIPPRRGGKRGRK